MASFFFPFFVALSLSLFFPSTLSSLALSSALALPTCFPARTLRMTSDPSATEPKLDEFVADAAKDGLWDRVNANEEKFTDPTIQGAIDTYQGLIQEGLFNANLARHKSAWQPLARYQKESRQVPLARHKRTQRPLARYQKGRRLAPLARLVHTRPSQPKQKL